MVAPYSGAILLTVARSDMPKLATPGPKYYINLPTTPFCLNILVTVKTKSVAVTFYPSLPVNLKPITSGSTMLIG